MTFIWTLLLLVSCAESDKDTTSARTTDSVPEEEGVCAPPDDLPDDPLEMTDDLWLRAEGALYSTHMVEVDWFPETQAIYGAGLGGFFYIEEIDGEMELIGIHEASFDILKVEPIDYRFVAINGRDYGLRILNVANPSGMGKVADIELAGASGMAYRDERLYVGTLFGELVTYDMSEPTEPVEIHRLEGLGNVWEIGLEGDYGYAADAMQGIVTLDMSDPDAPSIIGVTEAAGTVQDLDIDGGVLYVAAGGGGVEIFDLSDPASPESVASLEYGSSVISVSVEGGTLWATNQESVIAADVTDPANPVSLVIEETLEWAMHVVAREGGALVADWGHMERFELDRSVSAPSVELSRDSVYFTDGDDEVTVEIANRGNDDLVISGFNIPDERFSVAIDEETIAPGDAIEITLTYTDDGEPVDTRLCIATNDPQTSVTGVSLSTSSDIGANIAVGEQAVNFVLPDLDGNLLELAEQRGHPVLMAYFTTW